MPQHLQPTNIYWIARNTFIENTTIQTPQRSWLQEWSLSLVMINLKLFGCFMGKPQSQKAFTEQCLTLKHSVDKHIITEPEHLRRTPGYCYLDICGWV